MTPPSAAETSYAGHDEIALAGQRKRERAAYVDETAVPSRRFLFRLGRIPFELSLIEYHIIDFLASKPYRAFTRQQIIESFLSTKYAITEESLDDHIRTLRDKLGIFSDYVQSVPYIGYRFKP